MAIFTNMQSVAQGIHGYFESSNLKSTDVGNIWDVVVREDEEPIAIDNGVAVKVGKYTGNGLQERYGEIAKESDPIAVTGAVVIIKDAFTRNQNSPLNFFTRAGEPVKTYEVVAGDIFGVGMHMFTDSSAEQVKVGAYVSVDGNGQWVASASAPSSAFVGRVHSIAPDDLGVLTVVRILCEKNA